MRENSPCFGDGEIPEQQVAKLLYAANEMRIPCFIRKNSKGLVAWCHSFCLFVILLIETYNYNIITSVEAHSIMFTAAAQKRDLHSTSRDAEPGIEPGPAIQQADALLRRILFELRRTLLVLQRTLFELRRTLIWATPHPIWATPHPNELRRTLWIYCGEES